MQESLVKVSIKVGSKFNDWYPYKKRNQTQREERPHADRSRDGSAEVGSQGTPTAGCLRKLEGGKERFSPKACRGRRPCLEFRLLIPRTLREKKSAVFSHPLCGQLLQQPQASNELPL